LIGGFLSVNLRRPNHVFLVLLLMIVIYENCIAHSATIWQYNSFFSN